MTIRDKVRYMPPAIKAGETVRQTICGRKPGLDLHQYERNDRGSVNGVLL